MSTKTVRVTSAETKAKRALTTATNGLLKTALALVLPHLQEILANEGQVKRDVAERILEQVTERVNGVNGKRKPVATAYRLLQNHINDWYQKNVSAKANDGEGDFSAPNVLRKLPVSPPTKNPTAVTMSQVIDAMKYTKTDSEGYYLDASGNRVMRKRKVDGEMVDVGVQAFGGNDKPKWLTAAVLKKFRSFQKDADEEHTRLKAERAASDSGSESGGSGSEAEGSEAEAD